MVTDAEVGLHWHTVLHSSVLQTSDFFFFKGRGNFKNQFTQGNHYLFLFFRFQLSFKVIHAIYRYSLLLSFAILYVKNSSSLTVKISCL